MPPNRIWSLLCDGIHVASYTDHCQRTFFDGDILRDDRDNRRRVLSVGSTDRLELHVGPPDLAPPSTPGVL